MADVSNEPRDSFGRWIASGNDWLSRFKQKLATDARLALRRYTSGGGPGVKAQGVSATDAKKKQWAAESKFKTVAAILASSGTDQQKMVEIGKAIGATVGVSVTDPGAKSAARLQEKVDAGRAPASITDATRMGYEVKTPAQANAIIAEMAKHYQLADEGWTHTPAGYFDRKVIIRHPDGLPGEIQFWPPGMLKAKDNGGHNLYEKMQTISRKNAHDPALPGVMRDMQKLYKSVLDKLPSSWDNAKR